MDKLIITSILSLFLNRPLWAEEIPFQKFRTQEQGRQLVSQFDYALASIDRGNPLEAQRVLEEVLSDVSYDRRLFGYTRIAITYFQMKKTADARAVIQRIVASFKSENDEIAEKVRVVGALLKAKKFDRVDSILEEIGHMCGPDRKNILREINIARAMNAVRQHGNAALQVEKILKLLENENREDVRGFEFSLDTQILDSLAGAGAN